MVERMAMMGVEWVHFTADDGKLRTIRQAFTSVAAVDPFVKVAAGVALGGACVGMTEQASDGVEIEPAHHGVTCEGVPAVMDADIVKPCKTAKLADPSEDHSLSSTLSPRGPARRPGRNAPGSAAAHQYVRRCRPWRNGRLHRAAARRGHLSARNAGAVVSLLAAVPVPVAAVAAALVRRPLRTCRAAAR